MSDKPIKSKAAYLTALKVIESLMFARAGSLKGDRLEALVRLVEAYEKKSYSLKVRA